MHLSLLTLVSLILPGAYGAQVTTTTRQSIHGIGASGAWWVNDVASFPAEVRQNISELLLNQTWGASAAICNLLQILTPRYLIVL